MALFKKKPEFSNVSQVKSSVARGIRCESRSEKNSYVPEITNNIKNAQHTRSATCPFLCSRSLHCRAVPLSGGARYHRCADPKEGAAAAGEMVSKPGLGPLCRAVSPTARNPTVFRPYGVIRRCWRGLLGGGSMWVPAWATGAASDLRPPLPKQPTAAGPNCSHPCCCCWCPHARATARGMCRW